MTFRNIIVLIILSTIILLAIAGETYYYLYSEKQDSAAHTIVNSLEKALNTRQSPESALAQAQNDLAIQVKRLNQMRSDFPSSPSLDATIKKDVSDAAVAEAKANLLADKLKLDPREEAKIIALRQKSAAALAYLQSLANDGHVSTVTLNDAALNATGLISEYSKELSAYINSLTPSNSGLSSDQIAGYKQDINEIITEINDAQNSLNQIDDIPVNNVLDGSNGNQTSNNDNQNDGQANQNNQNSANNNQNNSQNNLGNQNANGNTSSSSSGLGQGQGSLQQDNSGNGGITLGDIVNQENVVSQANNEVNQLDNQITNGETPSPNSSDASSSPTENGSGNNGSDNGGNNSGANQIQPQSGPIKLIEGGNTL